MRVLITGAAGFIGSHLVDRLRMQHEVFALAGNSNHKSPSNVQWIEADLSRRLDHSDLPPRVDAIIHLAQSKYYREFPQQADDIFAVNVAGSFNLLEYARQAGAAKFIFASTGGVYGYSYEKFVETDPVNPLNFYLTSKHIAELLVGNYQQFFDTTVLRLFFVYGAGQKPTMLIPRLVRSVVAGDLVTLQGSDGLHINPVHVTDAVTAFERALELSGHHLINVGGPQVLTLREIANIIGERVGCEPVFTFEDKEPSHLVGDITKMSALLGPPRIPLREGVVELCDEARQEQTAGR